MPDCGYCGESFADEADYLDHLRDVHADELGPIDRRRVARDEPGGLPTGPLAIGVVLVAAAAVVGYVVFLPGGDGGGGNDLAAPHGLGSVHYHGFLVLVIDGDRVDFSRDRYQLQADAFHFEGGDGTRWHVHAQGVTLAWAMDSLGITVTADLVTIDGTTYTAADPGTSISVTVDDEPVTPSTYVLGDGDTVRITVEVG